MSDFDILQATMIEQAAARQADSGACEALLGALYQALRRVGGPGQPLHNVSVEPVADPGQCLRPPPVGEYHAAWFRLGLCEVLVRVRRQGQEFHGDYGYRGVFALTEISEDAVLALAHRILKDLTLEYAGMLPSDRQKQLN
ncbi:hypothetical protein [Deinococcus sp.]|uniref:hypothetical protein n=1 Tax=Deinococcus sp. TaxID=47478 RepID=UPI0025B9C997|nr:hypothetical protein [Deinococcus sp.]